MSLNSITTGVKSLLYIYIYIYIYKRSLLDLLILVRLSRLLTSESYEFFGSEEPWLCLRSRGSEIDGPYGLSGDGYTSSLPIS